MKIINSISKSFLRVFRKFTFNSEKFWMKRYEIGGNSGAGSYDNLAKFKAHVINDFVAKHNIKSIIEFGCGDGNQLSYAKYENYLGFDISPIAIKLCVDRYKNDHTKKFKLLQEFNNETAQLTLSLDVIYHLVEFKTYEEHLQILFNSSTEYVIIYSSNKDDQNVNQAVHIKHRKFSDYCEQHFNDWILLKKIPNIFPKDNLGDTDTTFSDFYIYKKI